jgi:hypothetical protein
MNRCIKRFDEKCIKDILHQVPYAKVKEQHLKSADCRGLKICGHEYANWDLEHMGNLLKTVVDEITKLCGNSSVLLPGCGSGRYNHLFLDFKHVLQYDVSQDMIVANICSVASKEQYTKQDEDGCIYRDAFLKALEQRPAKDLPSYQWKTGLFISPPSFESQGSGIDLIFASWSIAYHKQSDAVMYLKKMMESLTYKGVLVIRENIAI